MKAPLALGLLALACARVAPGPTPAEPASLVPREAVQLGPDDVDLVGTRRDEWLEREAAVERELRALGAHPWAGVYVRSDLFDLNWTLKAAPREGFTFRWTGCTGVTDRNVGTVHEENGVLVLECAWPNVTGPLRGCPERLTIVPWGGRVYLASDLPFFCSEVNAGHEPFVLSRTGAPGATPAGKPSVPAEFEHCLLESPLHAHVISVDAPEYLDDVDPRGRRTRVRIDVGRAEGAYVGLCLVTRGTADTLPAHIDVVALEEHVAMAEIIDHDSLAYALPAVGEECATRWK